jgi:hypothetical protein
MKRSNLIFAAVFAAILAGCEKQAQPVVVLPSTAPGQAAAPADATSAVMLDKIETNLGTTPYLSVDGLNGITSPASGSVTPVNGASFQIAGFAVDQAHESAAAGVVVVVDRQTYVAKFGGDRPDIAEALKNPNYLHSQFWAEIPTAGLGKGLHDVSLRVVAADRSGYYVAKWTGKISIE